MIRFGAFAMGLLGSAVVGIASLCLVSAMIDSAWPLMGLLFAGPGFLVVSLFQLGLSFWPGTLRAQSVGAVALGVFGAVLFGPTILDSNDRLTLIVTASTIAVIFASVPINWLAQRWALQRLATRAIAR